MQIIGVSLGAIGTGRRYCVTLNQPDAEQPRVPASGYGRDLTSATLAALRAAGVERAAAAEACCKVIADGIKLVIEAQRAKLKKSSELHAA